MTTDTAKAIRKVAYDTQSIIACQTEVISHGTVDVNVAFTVATRLMTRTLDGALHDEFARLSPREEEDGKRK